MGKDGGWPTFGIPGTGLRKAVRPAAAVRHDVGAAEHLVPGIHHHYSDGRLQTVTMIGIGNGHTRRKLSHYSN